VRERLDDLVVDPGAASAGFADGHETGMSTATAATGARLAIGSTRTTGLGKERTMSIDDAYERGLQATERLLGQRLELPMGPGEPASGQDFRRLAVAHTFGDSWTRTALAQHDRALVSVAIAATLGTFEPLRGQLRIALNSGVTKDELVDLFIHLAAYASAAQAFETYQITLEVFAESADAEATGT
jgi:4-carboxymuconolactone decarboxylase